MDFISIAEFQAVMLNTVTTVHSYEEYLKETFNISINV